MLQDTLHVQFIYRCQIGHELLKLLQISFYLTTSVGVLELPDSKLSFHAGSTQPRVPDIEEIPLDWRLQESGKNAGFLANALLTNLLDQIEGDAICVYYVSSG